MKQTHLLILEGFPLNYVPRSCFVLSLLPGFFASMGFFRSYWGPAVGQVDTSILVLPAYASVITVTVLRYCLLSLLL
jgi:hypothetical protein